MEDHRQKREEAELCRRRHRATEAVEEEEEEEEKEEEEEEEAEAMAGAAAARAEGIEGCDRRRVAGDGSSHCAVDPITCPGIQGICEHHNDDVHEDGPGGRLDRGHTEGRR